jgi:anaerobic ribonucleoside-triphosphate reductase
MKIIKRNDTIEDYNPNEIINAMQLAVESTPGLTECNIKNCKIVTQSVIDDLDKEGLSEINVYEIERRLIDRLVYWNLHGVANTYKLHRSGRKDMREMKTDLLDVIKKLGVETDRDNANVGNNFSAKLLRIASETNKVVNLANMPNKLAKAHENGDVYYHDVDSTNLTINCLHIDTGKTLNEGFSTGYGTIRKPNRFSTAAELSCILLQSTQNDMYGGQSHVDFDNDLAPFVDLTRQEQLDEMIADGCTAQTIRERLQLKVIRDVKQGCQSIVYNLNTMHSRAGSQVPFSSVNIGLPTSEDAALVCEMFLLEFEKGLGKGEQPIFPNIIFRRKQGVNAKPGDPYYYLYKLACRVAAKRMNPTFMNIDSDFNKEMYDQGIVPAIMGCRTYIMSNVNGEIGPKSRGNNSPHTMNLPRLGIRSKKDINKFFELLDETLLLARESILYRHEILKKLRVKDIPFIAGQHLIKGSEGLQPNDSIEPILLQGTYGIGFIGLAETLIALTGKHHGESEESRLLGIQIVTHIREFCDKHKNIDKLNWACYATPAESLCNKLIVKDLCKYGNIENVTSKEYYTNSFHIPVSCSISLKDKMRIEAPYHKLCNAGHISYAELDGYPTGDVIESIVNYSFDNTNMAYLGINFKLRYCKNCGEAVSSGSTSCSDCGCEDIQGISRVTGYLAFDERFGVGKTAEKRDRKSHDF